MTKESSTEKGGTGAPAYTDDEPVRLLPENAAEKPRTAVHPEDYAESWGLGDPDCERVRASK